MTSPPMLTLRSKSRVSLGAPTYRGSWTVEPATSGGNAHMEVQSERNSPTRRKTSRKYTVGISCSDDMLDGDGDEDLPGKVHIPEQTSLELQHSGVRGRTNLTPPVTKRAVLTERESPTQCTKSTEYTTKSSAWTT